MAIRPESLRRGDWGFMVEPAQITKLKKANLPRG
jgi:hypothetical protein